MVTQVLLNNSNKSNEYIKGAIELQVLKSLLKKNIITEDFYYYLKEEIIKEYQIFEEMI